MTDGFETKGRSFSNSRISLTSASVLISSCAFQNTTLYSTKSQLRLEASLIDAQSIMNPFSLKPPMKKYIHNKMQSWLQLWNMKSKIDDGRTETENDNLLVSVQFFSVSINHRISSSVFVHHHPFPLVISCSSRLCSILGFPFIADFRNW